MDNHKFYLTFSYFLGIGPMKFDILISHFSSLEKAYFAKEQELAGVLGSITAQKFSLFKKIFEFEKEMEMIKKSNITVLTREDKKYPQPLKNISDAPICLYVKGDLDEYDFESDLFFAIVGTRKPTSYGVQIAKKFSYELAQEGFVIVSGMAMGIDSVAHLGALEAGARTIAFLGCGVNIVYPPVNRDLYENIVNNKGLIISEFPPNATVKPGLFISRNRLISGLSCGVMVAEGLKDSGSLITAKCAADQGKDVFAPPAPITSQQSEAPNILIKEGAKMVTGINDILEEYSMSVRSMKSEDILAKLNSKEQSIYKLLIREPLDPDEIARIAKIPVYQVLPVISSLELKGVVDKNTEGKYQIVL